MKEPSLKLENRHWFALQDRCLMHQVLLTDKVTGTEQARDPTGRLHARKRFASGHLVPGYLPHVTDATSNNSGNFPIEVGDGMTSSGSEKMRGVNPRCSA